MGVSDFLLFDKYKHPLTALIGNEGVLLYLVVFSYLRCNFSRFCTNKGFLAPTVLPWLFCLHLLSYISLLLLPQPPQLVFCWLLVLLTCWLRSSSSWWCLSIIFLLCHRQPADHLLLIDQLYAFTSLRCLTWWLIIFATCIPWYSSLSLPLFESPPYLFLR